MPPDDTVALSSSVSPVTVEPEKLRPRLVTVCACTVVVAPAPLTVSPTSMKVAPADSVPLVNVAPADATSVPPL